MNHAMPCADFTNTYYGGVHPYGSDVYFVNGGADPWHVLSVSTYLSCAEARSRRDAVFPVFVQ